MNAGEQTNCSAQTVCTDIGLYNGVPTMARHCEGATQPKQSLGRIGFGLASIYYKSSTRTMFTSEICFS